MSYIVFFHSVFLLLFSNKIVNFYICEEFWLFFALSWLLKKFHIGQIVRVVKFIVVMFTYIAHFEGKVRNYTATKLFQLNCRRAVRNARRTGRLFPARLRHRVRPSYGTFINGFAKKKLAGPYGSYDKTKYFTKLNRNIAKTEKKMFIFVVVLVFWVLL